MRLCQPWSAKNVQHLRTNLGHCLGALGLALLLGGWIAPPARAADPVVDAAATALGTLTDPQRLETLPEATFRAQLGPALGWLHVARRRDVAPEAVIARAFARNGLTGERARLTRESLLRNLARADAWELFGHDASARAMALGKPALISSGIHQGHFAEVALVLPEGLGRESSREFACLVLRADDELPPAAVPPRPRQPGDRMAPRPGRLRPAPMPPVVPVSYDDPLPAN